MKELYEVIKYHISNKMLITIEREQVATDEKLRGFPLILTDEFLLMSIVTDFRNEGYTIINSKDITDAYSKESDEFYEKICKMEGLHQIDIPEKLNEIPDYKYLFDILKEYSGLISIQCKEQYARGTFFLGKAISTNDECVEILEIGMDGKWDIATEFIPFNEIIQVSFADNYSKLYYKYADEFNITK